MNILSLFTRLFGKKEEEKRKKLFPNCFSIFGLIFRTILIPKATFRLKPQFIKKKESLAEFQYELH